MSTIIGIDLGTTYSLVSVLRDGVPVVLPNALGEVLTPSAVSVRPDGELLVGAPARARAVTAPEATALAFKRDMGTPRRLSLAGKEFTPVELSALVLKALKADAEAALGHEVHEAVITVPAYFGDLQRQATKDAGALAGLKVERIINEPTAAALAYGLQNRNIEQKVVVLDLGGGTFDVTVLEIIEGVIEVQSTAGDARLGGEDFDEAVLALLEARYPGYGWKDDAQGHALLKEAARQARHRLTDVASTGVSLPRLEGSAGQVEVDCVLERVDCERAWAPLLARLELPIERALRDAGLGAKDVDQVLLVGGATRMPCVVGLATRLFGKLPLRNLPPDEAVALGAAVQAGLKAGDRAIDDVVATDVAPFSLGVATSTVIANQLITGLFAPLIERGTTIPCSRVKTFVPVADGQTTVRVEVFQGEHSECRRNEALGTYEVRGLPSRPAQENALEFRFTYDLNGILEVEITRLATQTKESFVLQQRANALTGEALEAARAALQKWKIHPRELLPNTTALERAEAVYATLRGLERERLGEVIARFRAAMERQEPPLIDEARAVLQAATHSLRTRS
ncbi:MAG: Hsp70 family protein [Myxococcota bacterium]